MQMQSGNPKQLLLFITQR